jgi:hypothetical protein
MTDSRKLTDALGKVLAGSEKIAGVAPEYGPFAGRKPRRAALVTALLLPVLYFGARTLLESTELTTPLRVVVALTPLPVFVWFLWIFIGELAKADELERRIQLEALAIAFPSALVLLMTLGLLQVAIPLDPDNWSYRHIWPLLYVFYLFGLAWARRRYA